MDSFGSGVAGPGPPIRRDIDSGRDIRWEGFVAIALGLLATTYALLVWLTSGNTGSPWLILISAGLVLVVSHLSIKRSADNITASESIPVHLISEGITIWFTVAALTTTYALWPAYTTSVAIPVAMALLYRSARAALHSATTLRCATLL